MLDSKERAGCCSPYKVKPIIAIRVALIDNSLLSLSLRRSAACVWQAHHAPRMQRFLSFRLGCHALAIVAGRFADGQHVDRPRANRVCSHGGGQPIGDDLHTVFECPALQAATFASGTDTM